MTLEFIDRLGEKSFFVDTGQGNVQVVAYDKEWSYYSQEKFKTDVLPKLSKDGIERMRKHNEDYVS